MGSMKGFDQHVVDCPGESACLNLATGFFYMMTILFLVKYLTHLTDDLIFTDYLDKML